MKSNQKLAIMFWLKSSKATKDGMAPLYVRITIDGEYEDISLSRKINPQFWDTRLKRDTEPGSKAKATNLKIGLVEGDLENHFTVLRSQFDEITPLMVKNSYLGLKEKSIVTNNAFSEADNIKTLLEAFADFISNFEVMVKAGTRSNETLKHWRTTKTKVAEFMAFKYRVGDINLADIPPSFANHFYKYLTLEADSILAEVTAKKHVKKTKQIVEHCVTELRLDRNPLKGFKCGGGELEVLPLEMAEVHAMLNKKIEIERLSEVRDAYIFQCFTGFAFQDIYGLSRENIIKVGIKQERWLSKERGKTGVIEMVPILPIVEELISKYATNPYCLKNNCLIPVNCNARYNAYLKELAVICGIKRELNTHLARHTFADIMLNNGVPLEDVSKMLGHKSIRTTLRYCRVKKSRISASVAKVKNILFTKSGALKKVS
ncbi:site-specific integrase [Mucilaginibacter sp. SMC90]|uniref:site-specific integrase n=1 Tax=Mucilaginibacter sp. SMC90 TaxID=2929803 RepID=UPI001FB4DB37|nr:site-specific integrase [Mucilaginibacter sp. SMC90]UOE51383.1 site-specific integrase [Mucilaginibacter sp. SMC90]